ncbi:methyl-accepting chemotaxis protein, partial [Paracraurococcus ruber]
AAAKASEERAQALVRRAEWELGLGLAALLVSIVVAAGAARAVFLRVVRPLRHLTEATDRLAAGALDTTVPGTALQDEVGAVARALETLRDGARAARRLEAETAEERARRDRRQAAMDQHTQEFGASIAGVLGTLGASAQGMRHRATEMKDAVAAAGATAERTARDADESTRNLGAVAAATEELTASATEIARQVAEATIATQDAVERAGRTGETVQGLSEAVARIGDVVRLIGEIAGQTNLLALNATIEAARAGEAGKGFAVVASEVKALAAQTARATEEIGQQIGAIQSATGGAVAAVEEVQVAIRRMDAVATAIAAAVEQQGAATREIASSVQTVAGTTRSTTGAMQDVSSATALTRQRTEETESAAAEVARLSDQLHEEVEHFLEAMRAADGDRRRFERVAGHGAPVRLLLPGGQAIGGTLQDISAGGAALRCAATPAAGQEVAVDLPGATRPVAARVARLAPGVVAVAFLQNPANRTEVMAALAEATRAGERRAAA